MACGASSSMISFLCVVPLPHGAQPSGILAPRLDLPVACDTDWGLSMAPKLDRLKTP